MVVLWLFGALLLSACIGAYQASPVNPAGAGRLRPTVEDKDAGLVGIALGFDLKAYPVIVVDRFTVNEADVKDTEDRKLAAEMPLYFQSEVVHRFRVAGLFERVVNLSESEFTPVGQRTLRLEGVITRLAPGSRALRYLVGFGAGASKAQAETRFIDVQSGQVVLVTADRREAAFGIFGGDSEEHLRESFSDMARDLARFLSRLRDVPAVAVRDAPMAPAPPISPGDLVGKWTGQWQAGRSKGALYVTIKKIDGDQVSGTIYIDGPLMHHKRELTLTGTIRGNTLAGAHPTLPGGPVITYEWEIGPDGKSMAGWSQGTNRGAVSLTKD